MSIRNEYVPVPRFIQDTPRGRMDQDPYSRLANDRIVFLGSSPETGGNPAITDSTNSRERRALQK